MGRRGKKPISKEPIEVTIKSLSHEGRGVAQVDGKTTFVFGALPGEKVSMVYTAVNRQFDEGAMVEVHEASPLRVPAKCEHFGLCGGCSLQHLAPDEQIKHKQAVLLEQLQHFGSIIPQEILPPITGPLWGYRHKARLGAKHVFKKEKVLVGFRERQSRYIADLSHCHVLHPSIGTLLPQLSQLIEGMSCSDAIPQMEVAIGEEDPILIFRHLSELTEQDKQAFIDFSRAHSIQIYLQPKGMDSVHRLWPETGAEELSYKLPHYDLTLYFKPTDFTQVNPAINESMIKQALQLLDPQPKDHILDLFCGLGNFSLPIAKQCEQLIGVEGDPQMTQRATDNAKRNDIHNTAFYPFDLTKDLTKESWWQQKFDKLLIDPPRSGALELLQQMQNSQVNTIVYVSCNPATLARDAGYLVNDLGYTLQSCGVMDMFPHTSHVESMALFKR